MAIMTSLFNNFEITALSFSPAAITPDQETNYSITIKNISGKKISSMRSELKMYYRDTSGDVRASSAALVYGGSGFDLKSISWAANASKTFTGVFKFTASAAYPLNSDTRIIPLFKGSDAGYSESYGGNETLGLMLNITANVIFSNGSNTDHFFNLRGENSEYLVVLDAKYQPSITLFDAERSSGVDPSDEGENLLTTIALAANAAAKLEYLSLELRYRDKADPTSDQQTIDITSVMTGALSNTIITLISELFDKNADWDVTLWFGDQYESASTTIVVSRAFANVHLSGARTGGVCFGSFSQATEGNPLFQCYYPAHFYAPVMAQSGINGITNFVDGEVDTGGRWIDGKKVYRFTRLFKSVSVASGTTTTSLGRMETFDEVETLIEFKGTLRYDTELYPLPRIWSTSAGTYSIDINNGDIRLRTIGGYSPVDVVVQIYYTKATEEASE